ncbi:hypothetical protein Vadar_025038 [Vaccinium darrowii]|uniref:Uncharacterized protein n=1 Tax=Vaccinium darrowii TaxID=229202 RepID=A0ACB7YH12_9ERIC|nr:hypothetical protein Vadar_025038 [Vaccinium darrowii]
MSNLSKRVLQGDFDGDSSDEDEVAMLQMVMASSYQQMQMQQNQQRSYVGSISGRSFIRRDRAATNERIYLHYFSEDPLFNEKIFRQHFWMAKPLFERILTQLQQHDDYFVQTSDAVGVAGLSGIHKMTATLSMLAYGMPADSVDECVKIRKSIAIESLKRFCRGVVEIFEPEYLRAPVIELDHETRECSTKEQDQLRGTVKENEYGSWMAATPSYRRGYKWKGNGGERPIQKVGRKETSFRQAMLSDRQPAGGGRSNGSEGDGIGKFPNEIDGRESRLDEVDDQALVAINGNQFRMGDLVAGSSRDSILGQDRVDLVNKLKGVHIDEGRGSILGGPQAHNSQLNPGPSLQNGPSPQKGGRDIDIINSALGCPLTQGLQLPSGPMVSSSPLVVETPKAAQCFNESNGFVDIHIFKASEAENTQPHKALVGYNCNKSGSKKGTIRKQTRNRSGDKEKGGFKAGLKSGKWKLEGTEENSLGLPKGRRILLSDSSNVDQVEAANPNGPPNGQ